MQFVIYINIKTIYNGLLGDILNMIKREDGYYIFLWTKRCWSGYHTYTYGELITIRLSLPYMYTNIKTLENHPKRQKSSQIFR